ncbi:DNA topoisomerase IV subunit B [unidentified eubacterium SCB49]|nr:DNA topoisomerase IV subunit B [unidentified eubacterium SCB49]
MNVFIDTLQFSITTKEVACFNVKILSEVKHNSSSVEVLNNIGYNIIK